MNSMEEMHSELDEYNAAKRGVGAKDSVEADLAALDQQLDLLKTQVTTLRGKLGKDTH